MDVGVFIPIANNGWLISKTSPQYLPSFELNKTVTQQAEHYRLDLVLSMIKLFASVAELTLPPAMVARMAVTIDSIAPGRFAVNIVSGWAKDEYTQMGLWRATTISDTAMSTVPSTSRS